MRFTDLMLGLPLLPVAIVVGRFLPEITWLPETIRKGPWGIALLLGCCCGVRWHASCAPSSSRCVRRSSSKRLGPPGARPRIIFRHILPNAMSPIIVQTTLIVGTPSSSRRRCPSSGSACSRRPDVGRDGGQRWRLAVRGFWWLLVFSGTALVLTVLSVNFIGDGLRDALDPTQTIERK